MSGFITKLRVGRSRSELRTSTEKRFRYTSAQRERFWHLFERCAIPMFDDIFVFLAGVFTAQGPRENDLAFQARCLGPK